MLAHLPSADFQANAAWLQLAVTAHALTRALGTLASTRHAKARGATIRHELIHIAGRPARSGREFPSSSRRTSSFGGFAMASSSRRAT